MRVLYLLCNNITLWVTPLVMTYLTSPLWTKSTQTIPIHTYPYIYILEYVFDSLSMLIYYKKKIMGAIIVRTPPSWHDHAQRSLENVYN